MKKYLRGYWPAALIGLLALLYLQSVFAHDAPVPARDTAYDWRCVDDKGVVIANRQRQDLAGSDCTRAAMANPGRTYYLEAGRYRYLVPATAPPPPPPPPPDATAALSWTAPTQNVDGTPITNGAGYKVYYGPSATNLPNVVDVPGWTTLAKTLTFPPDGTQVFFAVTAYNALGEESAKNCCVSKVMK